jgi:hypothetical protein
MNPPKAVLPILRKLRNSEPSDGCTGGIATLGLILAGAERRGCATDARRLVARLDLLDFGMVLLRKSVSGCYPENP